MHLRTIITNTTLLLLTLALGGCINASTNNPDQPSTIPPPVVPGPVTPGNTTPKTLPLTGFKAISTGRDHSCTIKNSDASLWCWGSNSRGQVGINNSADANAPARVSLNYLWQNISGGYTHSCGVALYEVADPADSSRKVRLNRLICWGDNTTGAIGYGTTTTEYFDPIVLQDDDWGVASAGNNHTCAIRLDKSLWCWGDNSNAQLGHNSAKTISPSQVDSNRDWTAISASDQFTCALRAISTGATTTEQRLFCWGKNDKSQFGDNTTTSRATPYQVSANGENWLSIATGQAHACAIKGDNTLWCWGDNSHGQIGNGTINNQPTPFQVTTASVTTWSAVATGHQHSCAIARDDKSLWCWGNNETGQLGISSTAHQPRPVKISHTKGWLMVAAGESHSCAIDRDEIVHCWGINNHGQIGNGYNTNTGLPRLFDASTNWQSIASGYQHSCGLKGSSAPYTLWCSGFNNYGQIGTGATSSQATLVQIRANKNNTIISGWDSLSTGPSHSCAIAINGASHLLFCWGNNSRGQLGDNATLSNAPQHWWPNNSSQVVVGMDDWSMVAAGANNSCGIKGVNELWCWGDNSSGQMANGVTSLPTDPPFSPTRISGSWLSVTVGGPEGGGGHICAIKTDGTLWCWGKNDAYQLGNYLLPDPAPASLPVAADLATLNKVNNDTDWVAVKAGERHSCAIKSNNTLWCWGDNDRGQTGALNTGNPFPTRITSPRQETGNHRWLDFDLGSDFTCAIRDSRQLWCWGDNRYKQLTSAIEEESFFAPKVAQSSPEWLQLALGQRHGCAIRENPDTLDRFAFCWGERAQYQFGDGNAWKSAPQPLSLQ